MRTPLAAAAATLLACLALLVPGAGVAAGATGSAACRGDALRVAGGCVSREVAKRRVAAIVREQMAKLGLKAAIVRVDTGERTLLSRGFGHSMAGVPARPDMYFRIGSIAIPHLITLLLQLEDEGRLSLDDRLSKYRPSLPDADRITLRMLANNTSGYEDWIQRNPVFVDLLLENPFRQWTSNELLAWAFAREPACEPGTCFSYAHTNYAVLSQVIATVTGKSVSTLMSERIFRPLGLRHTAISRRPAFPGPALHSYTAERGVYEDATFWSPSWTIGDGTVMSATIGDVARTARAVGRGELLSKRAGRERFAPSTAGFPPFNKRLYFGLGIIVSNGWQLQNPMLNGYTGSMAYLPARDLSIAVVATTLPRSADTGLAYATLLFTELARYLSPGRVPIAPGG